VLIAHSIFGLQLWIHWLLSFDGTVEVCHIETPAGKKERLEKAMERGKKSGKGKGKTNSKKDDTDLIESDELKSGEELDGVQEMPPGKKRRSQNDDEKYRPQKKCRTE
jgi:hypothetical protein